MPGFDGTGPEGRGPMTGGARGWCTPYVAPPPRNPTVGPYIAPARPIAPRFIGRYFAYGIGRPRWGLRWGGRGRGWERRGRGRC
jgi:hypothetical protein